MNAIGQRLPHVSKTCVIAMVVILTVHTAMLLCLASVQTPVLDETAHLPAGLSHWRFGRFDLYRVNPPLPRMIGAMPILAVGHKESWRYYDDRHGRRSEFQVGADFVCANGRYSLHLFRLARVACIPFSILGAWTCFAFARALYGALSGVFAASLWCFSPNVLAFGAVVMPDVPAAATGVFAVYVFWRWCNSRHWQDALVAGFALGLAALTKTTWILLFFVLPTLAIISRRRARAQLHRTAIQVMVAICIGVYCINLGYLFEGALRRLDQFTFASKVLGGPDASRDRPGNRFVGAAVGMIRVPFPADYLEGIDHVRWEFERKYDSYLRGEKKEGGWWYYYLYAMIVKMPVGTLCLCCWAIFMLFGPRNVQFKHELLLLSVAFSIVVIVSSQTGFNHHLRYILPAFPFLFILSGRLVGSSVSTKMRASAGVFCGWSIVSSLMVFPHSMSYFNEFAGGPKNGHAHLVSSNIDWGQDLLWLERWLANHPEVDDFQLKYHGVLDPKCLGIRSTEFSMELEPGWYVLSVHHLRMDEELAPFLDLKPYGMAGYSLYVYGLSLDDCNEVRRKLGLEVLPEGWSREPVESQESRVESRGPEDE